VDHPIAADVQRQHRSAVLANQLVLDARWGGPCRAYNLCIRPRPAAAAALSAIQASTLRLEPSLQRVPARALHANVAWLLPAHQEFDCPKDELWQRHGPQWLAILTGVAAATECFRLCYRRLVATNSAVIAVAEEPNRVSAIRLELVPALRLPGGLSAGELVHTTLFRYARPLRNPQALLQWLAAAEFQVDVVVNELLVIRERVFPSLDYEILQRLAPGTRIGIADQHRLCGQRSRPG
jgi:hypothetical protein